MSSATQHFGAADHVVFASTLLASLGIGLLVAVRSGASPDEYLLGGRRLSLVPAAVSMCVSVVSASTFLGAPAEMYAHGIHYQLSVLALPLGALLAAAFFVPLFYNIKLTSMNKYLLLRFRSRVIQCVGAALVIVSQTLYVGCVMYGPATALQSVTGLPVWASLLVTGVTGTVYTSVGGMKAVIWTDVFQSVVMVTGLFAIIIKGCMETGGFANVWRINSNYGRLDVNLTFDPFERYTLWTALMAYTFLTLTLYGTNQGTIQRYCAMTTCTKARWSILLNIPGLAIFTTLATLAGMVAFAFYSQKGCDPLQAGIVNDSNQLMPHFVMEVLNVPGLPGLFVASLFCATLSTLSSSVNSMVAVVWEDMLAERVGHLVERSKTHINKAMAVGFGLVCTCLSFLVWAAGGNILQISFTLAAITSGSQVGLFTIGMLVPCANWKGALTGTLSSMAVTACLGIGQIYHRQQRHQLPADVSLCFPSGYQNATESTWFPRTPTDVATTERASDTWPEARSVFSLSFLMFPLIGFGVCLCVGIITSIITGGSERMEVDSHLMFPCVRRFITKRETTHKKLGVGNSVAANREAEAEHEDTGNETNDSSKYNREQ